MTIALAWVVVTDAIVCVPDIMMISMITMIAMMISMIIVLIITMLIIMIVIMIINDAEEDGEIDRLIIILTWVPTLQGHGGCEPKSGQKKYLLCYHYFCGFHCNLFFYHSYNHNEFKDDRRNSGDMLRQNRTWFTLFEQQS